jgi:hypothetical protein
MAACGESATGLTSLEALDFVGGDHPVREFADPRVRYVQRFVPVEDVFGFIVHADESREVSPAAGLAKSSFDGLEMATESLSASIASTVTVTMPPQISFW